MNEKRFTTNGYYINDIIYDYVINEFVLVVKDGTGARYSTRGDIL